MTKVIVEETVSREVNRINWGYRVVNDIPGYRHLDYENRARRMNDLYLLEERNHPSRDSVPFRQITIVKTEEEADKILHKRVATVARITLEKLIPQLVDKTNITQRLIGKKPKKR